MNNRVLITGWTGTIGRPLARELRRRGYDVYGCDVHHGSDLNHIRADVSNARQMRRVFGEVSPNFVYHLAAEFGRHNGEEYFEQCWTANAIGTRNMMDLCKDWDVPLFFASSSEVYGEDVPTDDFGNTLPLHEKLTELTPNFSNEYAISKFTNELQIHSFKKRYGTDITVMRFFNAYGPGEHFHPYRSVVSLFCHYALNNVPFDVYEGYHRTFMFIDDFVPTLANMVAVDRSEDVYNIGGSDYRNIEDLARIVIEETGASSDLIKLFSRDEHNVLSKIPDITLARRDLGHDPKVMLEDGVPVTVEWMKQSIKSYIKQ